MPEPEDTVPPEDATDPAAELAAEPDGPPEHWLAYIKERAPQLVTPDGRLGEGWMSYPAALGRPELGPRISALETSVPHGEPPIGPREARPPPARIPRSSREPAAPLPPPTPTARRAAAAMRAPPAVTPAAAHTTAPAASSSLPTHDAPPAAPGGSDAETAAAPTRTDEGSFEHGVLTATPWDRRRPSAPPAPLVRRVTTDERPAPPIRPPRPGGWAPTSSPSAPRRVAARDRPHPAVLRAASSERIEAAAPAVTRRRAPDIAARMPPSAGEHLAMREPLRAMLPIWPSLLDPEEAAPDPWPALERRGARADRIAREQRGR